MLNIVVKPFPRKVKNLFHVGRSYLILVITVIFNFRENTLCSSTSCAVVSAAAVKGVVVAVYKTSHAF